MNNISIITGLIAIGLAGCGQSDSATAQRSSTTQSTSSVQQVKPAAAPDFARSIHGAAKAGDFRMIAILLKTNLNLVFSTDSDGWTPLHFASWQDHKDVAELLLGNKANVNAKDNAGFTPLHQAARVGSKAVAELLLAKKAEVNATNNEGLTPLDEAEKNARAELIDLLKQHGGQDPFTKNHEAATYLPITRADGVDFTMDVKRMDFTDGGQHMVGSISNLRVANRGGVPLNVDLSTGRVVDGEIQTKQFGVIKFSVPDATDPRVEYQLTKVQLKQVKEFLRSR